MKHGILSQKLGLSKNIYLLETIMKNSKGDSGGNRDVNFLFYLVENNLLGMFQTVLKRKNPNIVEEYYLERYKKFSFESDRHFLCRTVIQDELRNMEIDSISSMEAGNMDVLHSNCNYDIISSDFSTLIDIGLTPARNFFKGLTDLKVSDFMITPYFDDYIDEVIFSVFTRTNDEKFLNAVRDYEEGFKLYIPSADSTENDLYIE